MTAPAVLVVRPESIPEPLRHERRWVMWRYESRDGRWCKIPRQVDGQHAKTNDAATYNTFEAAVTAYATSRFDGIGFALGEGWCGVDLDDCRNPDTGEWFELAKNILSATEAYREVSPSNSGIKFIGRAAQLGFELRFETGKVVPFNGARFFAVTGHSLGGDPLAELTSLLRQWLPADASHAPQPFTGFKNAHEFDDDALLYQAVGSNKGERFLQLWRGDITGYASHSEADLALCRLLAFWTNGDRERVDRLFRQSSLYRDKWNAPSYRSSTLDKALS